MSWGLKIARSLLLGERVRESPWRLYRVSAQYYNIRRDTLQDTSQSVGKLGQFVRQAMPIQAHFILDCTPAKSL